MTNDPAAIAARLSEAQRRDILGPDNSDNFWSADGRTVRGMERKNLIEKPGHTNLAEYTPLGLAVRAHLQGDQDNG